MTVRHLGLTMVLAVTACGAPHALPSVTQVVPVTHQRSLAQVPRKWYVDGVHGSNRNDCASRRFACKTIAHAISLTSPGDSIVVAAATYPENLTVRHSLKILGSGAATTIIDGRRRASAFLITHPGSVVTLSRMTMRNAGGLGDGGAIYNCSTTLTIVDSIVTENRVRRGLGTYGYGGGIYNCLGSTLTIINSTFSRNSAEGGGAICNGGSLTIISSTFSGNVARKHRGGGIFNYGVLTVNNSTFSGNSVLNGVGGAIHNGELLGQTGTLEINNSTFSRNTAAVGKGGAIFNLNGATGALQNSIVSNNAGGNCRGMLTSNGYNLSSDDTCDFDSAGDLNRTDPKLGPLRDNGGPTQTMALLTESPAIDAGNPSGCTNRHGDPLKTDQRGEPRPDKGDSAGCDMGAYERQGASI
jgi:hypothetical protein